MDGLIDEIAELVHRRRLATVQRKLRAYLREHEDDPRALLLLGIVLLRSDWDRAAKVLGRAEQAADGDRYVMARSTAARLLLGDAVAYRRAALSLERSGDAGPGAAPPPNWPEDVASKLRHAVLEEPFVVGKVGEALVRALESGDPSVDGAVDLLAGTEHAYLYEMREQLRASKRINR